MTEHILSEHFVTDFSFENEATKNGLTHIKVKVENFGSHKKFSPLF